MRGVSRRSCFDRFAISAAWGGLWLGWDEHRTKWAGVEVGGLTLFGTSAATVIATTAAHRRVPHTGATARWGGAGVFLVAVSPHLGAMLPHPSRGPSPSPATRPQPQRPLKAAEIAKRSRHEPTASPPTPGKRQTPTYDPRLDKPIETPPMLWLISLWWDAEGRVFGHSPQLEPPCVHCLRHGAARREMER
ncbi:hypothetical protein GCM10022402_36310 [Salinactinospora qingdaonensis]|uniref:Uncharacterized protein n=1 Tax=Salinactinospora qingdaonensis TaxID=702744 RepID=A0ABP7G613_9ACTN